MANPWARDRARTFYLAFAGMAVAAVLIGFSTTYFIPGPRGTLNIPWIVHLHGWTAMGWVVLLVLQVRAGPRRPLAPPPAGRQGGAAAGARRLGERDRDRHLGGRPRPAEPGRLGLRILRRHDHQPDHVPGAGDRRGAAAAKARLAQEADAAGDDRRAVAGLLPLPPPDAVRAAARAAARPAAGRFADPDRGGARPPALGPGASGLGLCRKRRLRRATGRDAGLRQRDDDCRSAAPSTSCSPSRG